MPDTNARTESHLSNNPTNTRHFMWNDDYIELLSHHLGLSQVRNLVEIGSGLGYLSRLFGLYMKTGSTVRGFDPDPVVVAEALRYASANPFSVQFHYETAAPHALPLDDGLADMAICHHVLMNVPDAEAVVREMLRVVRPGGHVVVIEPNTMAQALVLDSDTATLDLEARIRMVRDQRYYERGKKARGHGDDSVGDALPGIFIRCGLQQVTVRISDKTGALVPPYAGEEAQARVNELMGWEASFDANIDFIHDCYRTGGGSEAEWCAYEAAERAQAARVREALAAKTYVSAGGLMSYIVMGVK